MRAAQAGFAWLTLLLLASMVGAQEQTVTLDREATLISFTLGATMHTVKGTIQLDQGTLRFDRQAGTLTGRVVIDARSAETGNDGRDKKMHAKILETEQYPQIVLLPQRFEGTLAAEGESQLTVHATLEIHGGSHAVTLPATVTIRGEQLSARLTLEVPYVEWGIEDPSTFVLRVAKKVEVTIETSGALQPAIADPSPE